MENKNVLGLLSLKFKFKYNACCVILHYVTNSTLVFIFQYRSSFLFRKWWFSNQAIVQEDLFKKDTNLQFESNTERGVSWATLNVVVYNVLVYTKATKSPVQFRNETGDSDADSNEKWN